MVRPLLRGLLAASLLAAPIAHAPMVIDEIPDSNPIKAVSHRLD